MATRRSFHTHRNWKIAKEASTGKDSGSTNRGIFSSAATATSRPVLIWPSVWRITRPRNPFINAGALVICDINQSRFAVPALSMRDFVRHLSGNPLIVSDSVVAESEYQHRARNAAMAYLMQAFGNFHNDVEAVLRSYFHHCALRMNCIDLARAFGFLARDGACLDGGEPVLSARQAKQVNAIMATSGLYDEAGNFAYRVGLPGKSGVGGGIVAVVPGRFTVCVWSPELNPAGNSLIGMAALEKLSQRIGWSIF